MLTLKSVVVAVPAVVEAMTKSVVGAPSPLVDVATREKGAKGEVVPMPRLPELFSVILILLAVVPPVKNEIAPVAAPEVNTRPPDVDSANTASLLA